MTESRETFETYPYNPDGASRAEPQDPPPVAMQPRLVPPPMVATPPPDDSRIGRRIVLGFAAAAGVAVMAGMVFNSARAPRAEEPEETPFDDEWTEEPIEEITSAYLELGDGESIYVDIPAAWQPDSEGDYLVISHQSGRLVARIPEWSRASRTDASREADYLRDGFDPSGAPTVNDESTTQLKVMHQVGEGHFAGE
ncbi:MAG: hypothetical protein KIT69_17495, partial [Propionibacteriaceae bacterium]|nr:hypothetical protein [Propionibacteriaceae bacterium]